MSGTRLQHWQDIGRNRLLKREPYAAISTLMAISFWLPPHYPGLWLDQTCPFCKRGDGSPIFHDMLFADQADRNLAAIGVNNDRTEE